MKLGSRARERIFWSLYAFVYDSITNLLHYKDLLRYSTETVLQHSNNARVLDAGCGTGNLAQELSLFSPGNMFIVGVDKSATMLKRAISKSEKNETQIQYIRADLDQHLPFKESSFDCVVALNSIYACNDPKRVLEEFYKVLKFGGRLVIANPKKNPKLRDGFIAHLKIAASLGYKKSIPIFAKTLFFAPYFIAVIIFNIIIKKKATRHVYNFLNLDEWQGLTEASGFRYIESRQAFGGTINLMILSKSIHGGDRPISIEVAETQFDFDAIFRLRYDVYCKELRSIDPGNCPNKKETDWHDQYSVHFLLRKNEKIIAALRLIRSTPRGFLMEEAFDLPEDVDPAYVLEPSRLVVHKEHRGEKLLTVLFEAAETWSRENGYKYWCFAAEENLARFYEKIGWNIKYLGPVKQYHGYKTVPGLRTL